MAEAVLETRNLSKYYGDFPALKAVSLRISQGEPVLIYGHNGAGKTTLLRVLASLAAPSEGEVLLGGLRIDRYPSASKSRVGFVSHSTFLYGDLSVQENLVLVGKLFGVRPLRERVDWALGLFGLRDRASQLVRNLSRGWQQRATLARALLHDPDFLLLDEPFTGLDAGTSASLEELLRRLAGKGKAVVFSTHRFAQGAAIASRCVLLERGRVRYDGLPGQAPIAEERQESAFTRG